MLFTHQEDPKYQCRFRWQPNSVAIWDNRCTQHYAIWDYFPEVRSGVRVSIIGDRPS
jgi:taurine dioxygenase